VAKAVFPDDVKEWWFDTEHRDHFSEAARLTPLVKGKKSASEKRAARTVRNLAKQRSSRDRMIEDIIGR
jgi:hypothetical protein